MSGIDDTDNTVTRNVLCFINFFLGGFIMLNQREAVYLTTMNVLAEHEINFDEGQNVEGVVTKELRSEIVATIVTGFQANTIEMSAEGKIKYSDEKKLRGYVSGLVSNWYRKDKRLNGGVKHEAKNPGSRVGSTDDQIKALRALRATKADDVEALAAIDAAIATRKSELGTAKQTVVLTDAMMALIPASLKAKLQL